MITHVILEIRALLLVENGVIFRYIHHRVIFKMAVSRFVDVSEGEINIIENTIVKLTSRKRLPTGVNRMLHAADIRIGLHFKSGFLHELFLLAFNQSAFFPSLTFC